MAAPTEERFLQTNLRTQPIAASSRSTIYSLGETVFGGCRHLEYLNI